MKNLDKFIGRLKKIDINVLLDGNYPWIYISSINGKSVTEKFNSEHGFTVAYLKSKANENDDINNDDVNFADISETFKLIRKYVN